MESPADAPCFTLESATRTLPLVRRIVSDIVALWSDVEALRERVASAGEKMPEDQRDAFQAEAETVEKDLNRLVGELTPIGCQLKDPRIGLVDFPAMHEGREVLLCWRVDEPEIAHWHEADTGFDGRRPVSELSTP